MKTENILFKTSSKDSEFLRLIFNSKHSLSVDCLDNYCAKIIEHNLVSHFTNNYANYFSKNNLTNLTNIQKKQLHYLHLISRAENQIEHIACQLNINLQFIKGSSFRKTFETFNYYRMQTDIDIYLSKRDLALLTIYFQENGISLQYEKKWFANKHKETYFIPIDTHPIPIEFHTKLYWHIDESKYIPTYNSKKLKLEDELIYLCYHSVFQHTLIKLFWLKDIYHIIELNNKKIDWAYLIHQADVLKLKRSVLIVLYILSCFSDIKFEYKFDFSIIKNFIGIINSNFLLSPESSKIKYLALKHCSRDDIYTSIKYDLGWLNNKLCGSLI